MVSRPLRREGGPPYRTVFMGTPDFAVPTLHALLATEEVVGVFTQPDRPAGRGRRLTAPPVKREAEKAGLPVLQPKSLRRDPEVVAALAELAPQVIVVAAYGLILPPEVLAVPVGGCLNVHASLLPRWRGAAPVTHALLAGDRETGVTIMKIDEGLDTGPILTQRSVPVGADETAGELTDRLAELGAELLAETLPRWMAGELRPRPQDDAAATLAPRLDAAAGWLDWHRPAAELAQQVRALNPWPGAFTMLQGRRLKVLAAGAVAAPSTGPAHPPGELLVTPSGPAAVTGDGLLRLDQVQPAGGRPMSGAAFLRGRPEVVGAQLGRESDQDDDEGSVA